MATSLEQPTPKEQLRSDSYKRKNGVYYTPTLPTEILCQWAIQSPSDLILEPSFGGCGFLQAAYKQLVQLNCADPLAHLFGCDVDEHAFVHLAEFVDYSRSVNHFVGGDFLELRPPDLCAEGCNVVIGNPPYVSHHDMSEDQKQTANSAMEAGCYDLDRRASLWAYFVFHCLSFLHEGGRVAWILPASFLYADYSVRLRQYLEEHFRRSVAFALGERLFLTEGTEERSVVFLAEGWKSVECQPMEIGYVEDVMALRSTILGWACGTWHGTTDRPRPALALLSDQARMLYSTILDQANTKTLSEVAKLQIGIVTGANDFFILSDSEAASAGLAEDVLQPILAKFNFASGVELLSADLSAARQRNERCLLVDTSGVDRIGGTLAAYLDSFPVERRQQIKTFKKRSTWHRPNDGRIPDGFFPCMHQDGPRIVLNNARVLSTNTVHRLFFNTHVGESCRKKVTISLLSTFSQLSAEIEGRTYGSGVLKHEPSEAERISLMIPNDQSGEAADETFRRIDALLRVGQRHEAQLAADRFVMGHLSEAEIDQHRSILLEALRDVRSARQQVIGHSESRNRSDKNARARRD